MVGKYVGILFSDTIFKGIPYGRTGNEKLHFYEEGARIYGLKPCFFRIRDIKPGTEFVRAYVKGAGGYAVKRIPIPKVIHNRALHKTTSALKMRYLASKGVIVFNGYRGKVNKMMVHRMLARNPFIRKHLPVSLPGTAAQLKRMMQNHQKLLIKPRRGSLGKGIKKIERTPSGWKFNISKNKSIIFSKNFPRVLKKHLNGNTYFIQQYVPLATYKGSPFDIRVSVQKNRTGRWAITGMVTKVAARGHYVSNVYQGGRVYQLQRVLAGSGLNNNRVKSDVTRLSLAVAKQLSRNMPYLADLGLDVGITKRGFPYFIECNRREQRYSFREGGLHQIWKKTHMNPMGYAKYLLSKKKSG